MRQFLLPLVRHLLMAGLLALPFTTAKAQGLPGALPPVKEGLEIGTSTTEIAITSDFRGADLTVFGALTNADELF